MSKESTSEIVRPDGVLFGYENADPDIRRYLALAKQSEMTKGEDAAKEIAERILASETVDDVFAAQGAINLEDVGHRPFFIDSVEWRFSDIKDGLPVYALVGARYADNGAILTITCGSRNVMAQLYRFSEVATYPTPALIAVEKATNTNGRKVYWLEKYAA